jgi:hypothetical protein
MCTSFTGYVRCRTSFTAQSLDQRHDCAPRAVSILTTGIRTYSTIVFYRQHGIHCQVSCWLPSLVLHSSAYSPEINHCMELPKNKVEKVLRFQMPQQAGIHEAMCEQMPTFLAFATHVDTLNLQHKLKVILKCWALVTTGQSHTTSSRQNN